MTKVIANSSLISSIDFENGQLTVNFTNGRRGVYTGVPQWKVDRLVSAESPGQEFNREIRNVYPYSRA